MTDLDALSALLAAATRFPHEDDGYGGCVSCVWMIPNTEDEYERVWYPCPASLLPSLIEAARREAAARFVAEYWRDQYMEGIQAGDSKWAIGTHPLALVLAALDGETDPRQLGLPESADDALRALLHDSAGAATPGATEPE